MKGHPIPCRTFGVDNPEPGAEVFNRELSWLAFNHRVLYEALDRRTPLLERVRFLGIFTSNLDEFFMKRVGGLKRQILAGVSGTSLDGMSPGQQLSAIRQAVVGLLDAQARCFQEEIVPALQEQGVHLLPWRELDEGQRQFARGYFERNVFPVVTPFAVDPGHPFPVISNLSVSLGVKLAHHGKGDRLFARVKVPEVFPQWLRLNPDDPPNESRFVRLADVIHHHLDMLFPGMDVLSVTPFRVTRNADIEFDDDDAEDLLEQIENELKQRRFASIVRIEHGPEPDPWVIQFLMEELDLTEPDVYELPAELDYTELESIVELPLSELKYPTWTPLVPPIFGNDDVDIFSVIRSGDMLVHHPYESFSASVERLINAAADDPKVLAIKLTLYRIGESQPLMDSLIRAAEQGKQVICLVELKARFDEQRNIYWAQHLEEAGVHVVYGVLGLKTHTKLTLIVRQEAEAMRCYTHIGTGNYNVQTARLYTDLGLFTCHPDITREVVELFHYLTGRSVKSNYEHLLVAPMNMRRRFISLIQCEIDHRLAGRPARIIAKMNSLEDRRIIHQLYEASRAGVSIDLIVRGFCCLRPGVEGLSENIRVRSIIGRFLEHSRIFYFRSGADSELGGQFLMGSADWMYRNLSNRVELVAPVFDPGCKQKLWENLQVLLADQRHCWDLNADGSYVQRTPTDRHPHGTHEALMELTRKSTDPGGDAENTDDPPQAHRSCDGHRGDARSAPADLDKMLDQIWDKEQPPPADASSRLASS